MKCIISGLETNNKWRNKPILKCFVDRAKKYTQKYNYLDIRSVLQSIQEDIRAIRYKKALTIEEYVKLLENYLEDKKDSEVIVIEKEK